MPDPFAGVKTPPRRGLQILAIGLAAAGLGLAAWLSLGSARHSVPTIPVPSPNGYDDLLGAAGSIVGTPPRFRLQFAQILRPSDGPAARRLDPMGPSWAEAGAYLIDNRDALARARVGLGRECVVPVAYEPGYARGSNPNRKALEDLARLLIWEAQVAVHEGRDDDGARSYLDVVRLGRAAGRGGLETDAWVGMDIETGGLLGIYRLVQGLGPATCREAIAALGEMDRSREPLGASRDRQAECQVAEQGRFHAALWDLANFRAVRDQAVYFDESYQEAIAMTRLVRIELALRAYRSESGDDPALLDDLVPSILPEIPPDPFTGRAPVYRKRKGGHQLYSVGPDRVDDDGAPLRRASRARSGGDILPDSIGTTLIP